ncbi:hypothetical protein HPB49_009388 [Dermacentor silvarum]|uniref:Uncharacterized protein n=1 Tax=Dermacentor silvarum TaxID=543639 RepID=A0ACB8DYL9_DERSI|nr:hypothetical protein HPB49_009388 [Dermacentor silvarum]
MILVASLKDIECAEVVCTLPFGAFRGLGHKYVLLGKIQTDCLESRFGQYRQMAGGNYHISIRHIYETKGRIRLQNTLPVMSSEDLKGIEDRSLVSGTYNNLPLTSLSEMLTFQH